MGKIRALAFALAHRFTDGVRDALAQRGVPWHIVRLGARAEYGFSAQPPRNGGEAAAIHDGELEEYMHLQTVRVAR